MLFVRFLGSHYITVRVEPLLHAVHTLHLHIGTGSSRRTHSALHVPCRGRSPSLFASSILLLGPTQPPMQGYLPPRVKGPECEADRSLPTSATPPYVFMAQSFSLAPYRPILRPPLWSSSQSSWLQIRRPGFDSWHYQKKVVGLERGPLSLVSTTEELLDRKVAAPV
jgi:hypothetical protein